MHVCHVQVMSKLMLAAIDAKVKKLAEYSSKTARTVRLAPHVLPITNHSLFILHVLLCFIPIYYSCCTCILYVHRSLLQSLAAYPEGYTPLLNLSQLYSNTNDDLPQWKFDDKV